METRPQSNEGENIYSTSAMHRSVFLQPLLLLNLFVLPRSDVVRAVISIKAALFCSLSTAIMCGWLASSYLSVWNFQWCVTSGLGVFRYYPSCLFMPVSVHCPPPTMCLTVTGSSLLMFFRTCYCAAGLLLPLAECLDTVSVTSVC